jgi:cytochrome c6
MKIRITLLTLIALAFNPLNLAFAADAEAGKTIFSNNCSGCHNNGLNVIAPEKTLQKAVLEKNGMFSKEAIIKQVTKGKSPMPAFGGQLSVSDIENVAAYVLKMANSGWK